MRMPPVVDRESFQPAVWRFANVHPPGWFPHRMSENDCVLRRWERIPTKPASRLSFHVGEKVPAPDLRLGRPAALWHRAAVARTGQPDPNHWPTHLAARSAAFFLMAEQTA